MESTVCAGHEASQTLGLEVVEIERVIPHEFHDPNRVSDLVQRLRQDQKLINPPIVAPWKDKLVILDGATRYTACLEMKLPHLVVQIVRVDDSDVGLESWQHGLEETKQTDIEQLASSIPQLELEIIRGEEVEQALSQKGSIALCEWSGERFGRLYTTSDDSDVKLESLNHLVSVYTNQNRVIRTRHRRLTRAMAEHPRIGTLLRFSAINLSGLLEMAGRGSTMPAGITRFVIPGRVLRLNAPLEILASSDGLKEKKARLEQILIEKFARRQIRHYQEPVILLDE